MSERLHLSQHTETDMFPGNMRFCCLPHTNHTQNIHWLSSILLSLSLLITHRRQCQGHKFCPHHYLLITVFVQARSVRGNRWCVWQCVQHQACSALVRVDRVDMCPDHKAQTCIQVTNRCPTALGSQSSGFLKQCIEPLDQWCEYFHYKYR